MVAPGIATSVLAVVTGPVLLLLSFTNYQNVMLHAQLYFLFVFEARNLIFLFGVNKVLVLVLTSEPKYNNSLRHLGLSDSPCFVVYHNHGRVQ